MRRFPGSRRLPHFARDAMAEWLPAAGVGYRWDERLGGRRSGSADSPDVVLRNSSFRAYAGWMREPQFGVAMAELLAGAAERRTAVMCSESVWWRCHRRLIADSAVLLHDQDLRHLFHDGRLAPHLPTDGVRRADGHLIYDVSSPAETGTSSVLPGGASGQAQAGS